MSKKLCAVLLGILLLGVMASSASAGAEGVRVTSQSFGKTR